MGHEGSVLIIKGQPGIGYGSRLAFFQHGNSMSVSFVGTEKGAYTGLIRNINIIGGSG